MIQRVGRVEQAEMDRTFNMGIGMIVVVAETDAAALTGALDEAGEAWHRLGRVTEGGREVAYV